MRFQSFITVLWTASFSLANAFTFSVEQVSQCGDLSLSWVDGQAPFQLLMIPVFGTPRNVSIPATAQGSFSVQVPFPKDQRIVFTMSDATGFGSGGTTGIQTVGASVGGKTCNTVDPGVSFSFQLNSVLQQCRPYTFSDYSGAIQPVTIMALIPGGQSVVLKPPAGSTTFDWLANVEAGTSMIFVMVDSQGRQGGSSDVKTIGDTGDRTCLSGSSPSSTSALTSTSAPSSASTSSRVSRPTSAAPTTSTSSPPAQTSHAARISLGVIAGAVVGALVAVAAFVTLGLFFLRRRGSNRPYGENRSHRHSRRLQSHDNLHYQPQGQGVNPFSYSYPAPMTSSPSSATHFMPFGPDLTSSYMQPLPPQAYPDADSNLRSPPLHSPLPFNAEPSMRPSPQPSVPRHTNDFMLPPSYNANSNMQPAPQQALDLQTASPHAMLPAQQAPYNADPNMQSPLSQPPLSVHTNSSIPQQSPISQKANPFLQRSPSPSLLPYDADPYEPSQTPLPSSQTRPTSGFSQIEIANDSVTAIARQKAAEAGEPSHKPTRLVLHTDVDELRPNEEDIVELPPQYSDHRSPGSHPPHAHQQQPQYGSHFQ